ncbi:MAG TPA: hypothetical protein PLC28_21030 [Spirochaetota bacterium]|nr:hypothetical protein [Spirochaetota bacterium]HPC43477.1 hypothetical protein [Spirochaetota bacterium]HPL17914.1 hypothetical protein [Spirochaetota bacterium]HQJ73203.1 hypothetical protein [Spirochaetota bacterium]HRS79323.1 hypothetical protein [Spirochaetota bacterium]
MPPPARFDYAFKKILPPFIVVTVLCLWEEIFLRAMILDAHYRHDVISSGRIIAYLILGEIIPVLVIMMFQPPLTLNKQLSRSYNTDIAAGEIFYYTLI